MSDFPEIYFLGFDLRRYDTCQFSLLNKKKYLYIYYECNEAFFLNNFKII